MQKEKNMKTPVEEVTQPAALHPIDELVRDLEASGRPSVLDEYMYMGVVPFFRYYLENTRKYLGKRAARAYQSNLLRMGIDLTEEDSGEDPYLIDFFVRMIKEERHSCYEDFLYSVIIMPMQVVRAKKEREAEKRKEDNFTDNFTDKEES